MPALTFPPFLTFIIAPAFIYNIPDFFADKKLTKISQTKLSKIMNMKRFLITSGLLLLVILVGAGIADAKKKKVSEGVGKIEFTEKVYDFGKIKEKGGLVSHDFVFTNAGDGNLVIIKATAECGCTRPAFPDAPIAPGKTNKIKVTYNPLGRPGHFEKVVTVTTTGNPRKVNLKIRGVVEPGK